MTQTKDPKTAPLKRTPLHELHLELGGKMVPFAGYEMPVQYPMGVLKEHQHTRTKAGLFDVSHMGQCFLNSKTVEHGSIGAHEAIAKAIETLVPGEIQKLKPGRIRYSLLLNDEGGIRDDLMITRPPLINGEDKMGGRLFLVVNAAVKDQDFAYLRERLGDVFDVQVMEGFGLLALQGPMAATILASHAPEVATMPFMSAQSISLADTQVFVSRCGYTGEDGFEISCQEKDTMAIARLLLAHDEVEPIGLGARDSLRLEAGLCLYGHDMDERNSPVEANLGFALGKRRREEGGFAGADRILRELSGGPSILRVGIQPEGRAPAREGVEIQSVDGKTIGQVTSGGFGPTHGAPVAMGYVDAEFSKNGTPVQLMVRGKALPAKVADMPFVPQNYYRG